MDQFVLLAVKVFEAGMTPRTGVIGAWCILSWYDGEWVAVKVR